MINLILFLFYHESYLRSSDFKKHLEKTDLCRVTNDIVGGNNYFEITKNFGNEKQTYRSNTYICSKIFARWVLEGYFLVILNVIFVHKMINNAKHNS